tara:strand:- start:49 stop:456 length:408 start_codon:yes stop_codon:yes gene_type:complete
MNEAARRGKNNRARGLAIERKVRDILMRYMNTIAHRIAIRGTAAADVETDLGICPYCLHTECEVELAVEVKSKQTATPAFLQKAFDQINAATLEVDKQPLVVVSYKDGHKRSYYAMFELHEDFDPWANVQRSTTN